MRIFGCTVSVQSQNLDRAQQAWDQAIKIAEADGDSTAAENHRGNLRILDGIREKLQRAD